jgi:hypothetical protein
MNRTLYELCQEMIEIEAALMDAGGDLSNPRATALADQWFATSGDFAEKVDAYVSLIREIEDTSEVRKREAARLANRAKIGERAAKQLRERLLYAFDAMGKKTVETSKYRVTAANNGGKQPIDVHAPEDVPERYCDLVPAVPEHWEPNREKILAGLAKGDDIPGVAKMDCGRHVNIR